MIAGTSNPSSARTKRIRRIEALAGSRSGSVVQGDARLAAAAPSRLGSIERKAELMRTNASGAVWSPSIQIIPGSV